MIDMLGISRDVPITNPERARQLDKELKEFADMNYEPMKLKWQQLQSEPEKLIIKR
ncbi:MAG: hypothetical protein AAF846_05420 [Chloroflexota bacterium]